MNIAFYTAASGLQSFQDKLDVTANNMANVNTPGFKKMNASFQDLLYTNMNTKVDGTHRVGHGNKVNDVEYVFQQGLLQNTERPLDFAVVGTAYFAVDDGNGNTLYTRDGSFGIGMQDGTAYLVNGQGHYVLNGNGQRITVPYDQEANRADVDAVYNQIGLYVFENPYGLEPAGGNLYRAGANAGARTSVVSGPDNRLVQNALEASMADMADGMVEVIEAQRAFQLNGKIVSTADQVEEIVNNLR